MEAFRLSVSIGDIQQRINVHLGVGSGVAAQRKLVWQQGVDRLLIHADTLQVKALDGWLIASMFLETDQTKRQNLQFVYCLGTSGVGDGQHAAATINAPAVGAAQIADRWGDDLLRVMWDAVLDAVEAAVQTVAGRKPGQLVTLLGFHCSADALQCEVATEDANAPIR